jgi:hypothetical protein
LAEEIGKAAEQYRHDLAIEWLGSPMPNWSRPCPIRADVSPTLGAGGATSFVFDKGEVFGWDMKIQGSEERVLDSVLPHEVTHTVFASHFRQPLPRWADEGACTTVEHASERNKQQVMLINFLRSGRGIAFDDMFAMKEYPADVLPLYSQGYSLARFLIEQKGRHEFLDFVGEGMKSENWPADLKKHYGYASLNDLQTRWLGWVKQGSPTIAPQQPAMQLASATRPQATGTEPVYRAQNNDGDGLNSSSGVSTTPIRRDAGLAARGVSGTPDDNGWTDAGSPSQGAGERGSVIPQNSGWYASQREPQGGSAANGSGSGDTSPHQSVYDRQARGTAQTLPPVPPASVPTAQTTRAPEYVAQRDANSAGSPDHKVLLDWTRTE